MRERILEVLKEIEQNEHVKILFAVESGSRAWGFESVDSDYDVRFVYVHKLKHYLRIDQTRDVIELPIVDDLDINGWDLKKALQLMNSSNPALYEWLQSPIVYVSTPEFELLKDKSLSFYQAKPGLYHYLSYAFNNFKHGQKQEMIKVKQYFYILRPILACRWILERGTPPPVPFEQLVETMLEEDMKEAVNQLVELKKQSKEVQLFNRNRVLDHYIEQQLVNLKQTIDDLAVMKVNHNNALNQLFLELLKKENEDD